MLCDRIFIPYRPVRIGNYHNYLCEGHFKCQLDWRIENKRDGDTIHFRGQFRSVGKLPSIQEIKAVQSHYGLQREVINFATEVIPLECDRAFYFPTVNKNNLLEKLHGFINPNVLIDVSSIVIKRKYKDYPNPFVIIDSISIIQ